MIRDAGDRPSAASAPANAARLVREPLTGAMEPLVAARWLRGEPHAVALSGAWDGGGMLMTSHPAAIAGPDEDPFALLGAMKSMQIENEQSPADAMVVGGGWFGWLGFELARSIEQVPPAPPRPQPLPAFDLAYHDHVIRCDRDGRWWFEALWTQERDEVLRERLDSWRTRLRGSAPAPEAAAIAAGPLTVTAPGTSGHAVAVAEAIQRIVNGEVFQANICLRLEGPIDGDLLDLWLRAATELKPSYAAYVGGDGHAVASLSPELFLRRQGRSVQTRPIKGTAPRSTPPGALAESAKDRAENVMIVDLMRNDLGRVCEYGSVRATGLWEVEPAAGVWHLVSTVRGTLRAGAGDSELLRATFPPGSVTGAPKVQVLRVIHQLEASAREVYCGAIGVCSPLTGLELNVAIRTFERRGARLWLGVGGGVVSDSSPQGEVQEALAKARGVAAAAGVEVQEAASVSAGAAAVASIVVGDRPDPARGVFETILVSEGRPVDLAAHLSRIRASGEVLRLTVPDGLENAIAGEAAQLKSGGVRLLVDGDGAQLSTRQLPDTGTTALSPLVLPGGLGGHKWVDRALIDSLSRSGSTPLFCDLDGQVLEAGYAAVLIVEGDTLIAPPLDGRILPSVSRVRLLAAASSAGLGVRIASFTLERMRAADAILLSSSLRGPHPGKLPSAPATELAQKLSTRLGGTR